ncbi:head-tail connector protein [Alcaligenes sp. SMD-FA]|uniref:head-tail connector protein n=1 Tax=Alcaligenes sp. SMD-FA TaxID=2991054 RepID=UPI0022273BC9|nr:head-tail connector protein [Alcaligenes sp. SMD-FA]UYY88110.1 head-tail connector protein [Alcaligenes sp. SMD-FA]
MISLGLVREHCRADPEDVSDELLTSYLNGAIRLFERRTGRKLYPGPELPGDALVNALLLDADVQTAILLLVEHRNVYRGEATEGKPEEIPLGAQHVMNMCRWFYD